MQHPHSKSLSIRLDRLDFSLYKLCGFNTYFVPKNNPVIRLNRLDLSLYTFCGPKTVIIPSTSLATISFCRDCADNFDVVFEQKRKAFVAPYEKALQERDERSNIATKQFEHNEKRWQDGMKNWAKMDNRVEEYREQLRGMIRLNNELRKRVASQTTFILSEHNYFSKPF